MSKDHKKKCPYDLQITDAEERALHWLQRFLIAKSKSHDPSRYMAHLAHVAFGEVMKQLKDQHDKLHEQENELAEAETIVTGLVGTPHAMGWVKEGDWN